MRDLLLLAIHLLVTLAKLLGPGGTRQVAAELLLLKHQLLISNRSRQRAPNLTMLDRLVLGLGRRPSPKGKGLKKTKENSALLSILFSALIRSLWVNRVTLTVGRPLPVFPDQRTSSDRPSMSG